MQIFGTIFGNCLELRREREITVIPYAPGSKDQKCAGKAFSEFG